MNNNERPSFGVETNQSPVDFQKLTETRQSRPECGASWEKISKNGAQYNTIKLTFTKKELQELLDSTTGDQVELRLVSFKNSNKDNNPRRPSWRYYRELNQT